MSGDTLLPCVEIEPKQPAEASVVWLHGLGANGHDFEPVAHMLMPKLPVPMRFVLPHAPTMPVTLNGGAHMPAWYDMLNLDHPRNVDWDTVQDSEAMVSALLERERERGIPSERLFLAGFSQGGALTIRMGLKGEQQLAGLIALSTYVLRSEDESFPKRTDKPLPVFMGHGEDDPIIPFHLAQKSCELLREHGCEVQWEAYPIPHSVCEQEIEHLTRWFTEQLKK